MMEWWIAFSEATKTPAFGGWILDHYMFLTVILGIGGILARLTKTKADDEIIANLKGWLKGKKEKG